MQIDFDTLDPAVALVVLMDADGEVVASVARPEPVVLTLTSEQAQTLRNVCARIGGRLATTDRRHTAAITDVLEAAGYAYQERDGLSGYLTFNDE